MAGFFEIFFDIDRIIAKGGLGFAACGGEGLVNSSSLRAIFMPRPPPPEAALTSTESPYREPVPAHRWFSPRRPSPEQRNTKLNGFGLGRDFVSHQTDVIGLGTDKADIVGVQNVGKFCVLRQKSISGCTASAPVISHAAMMAGMLR